MGNLQVFLVINSIFFHIQFCEVPCRILQRFSCYTSSVPRNPATSWFRNLYVQIPCYIIKAVDLRLEASHLATGQQAWSKKQVKWSFPRCAPQISQVKRSGAVSVLKRIAQNVQPCGFLWTFIICIDHYHENPMVYHDVVKIPLCFSLPHCCQVMPGGPHRKCGSWGLERHGSSGSWGRACSSANLPAVAYIWPKCTVHMFGLRVACI